MTRKPDIAALKRLIAVIDDEWTDGLCQNSEVMSNARVGKDAAAKVLAAIDRDHPAYAAAWLAWNACAAILKCEEAEDLRQKGISGLWERHKPLLMLVIKAYEEAERALGALPVDPATPPGASSRAAH